MSFKWSENTRTGNRSWQFCIQYIEAPNFMSPTNNLLRQKILKDPVIKKNKTKQFKARVILLIDMRLNEKSGRLRTEDNDTEGVKSTVPIRRTQELDPSAKVTLDGECEIQLWIGD
jgi:hypothetical protein